ncbi:MAG: DUF2442 domain-containing protein [Gallionellaceae bacterium]|nr:MAG: DUF2442 domain-containing protein [Gallionellaceae bacterium]
MRTIANPQENLAPRLGQSIPWHVVEAKPLPAYKIFVKFVDGTEGRVDMFAFLERDCGVFKVLRDVDKFNALFIEHGAVTWPNELDLAPDKMHDRLQGADVYVMR